MKIRNDVVLLANRRAGYSFNQWSMVDRWAFKNGIKEYVLTQIEELGPLIANLDPQVRLIMIYGGDGTIFHVLNFLVKNEKMMTAVDPDESSMIVPIGGGTMKRLPRYTYWTDEPVENARKALKFYDRHYRACLTVPLLKITWNNSSYVGFTSLAGALVRVMMEYSRFKTTPILAFGFSAAALGASFFGWPPYLTRLYDQFEAEITADSQKLPYQRFMVAMADTMDSSIFKIAPYQGKRGKNQFNCLAYMVDYKAIAYNFPKLALGRPPASDRYFNQPTRELTITATEMLPLTIDGEFFSVPPKTRISITLGQNIRVLVNPTLSIPLLSQIYTKMEAALDFRKFLWPEKK